MRICTKCGVAKDVAEFSLRKSGRVEWHCKSCKAENARAWARANPERNRNRATAWNTANRDRANRRMLRKWHERRRVPFTAAGWAYAEVLRHDPCAYCGSVAGEVDHIVPVAGGGDGDWENLTAACRSCNARKNAQSLLGFLVETR